MSKDFTIPYLPEIRKCGVAGSETYPLLRSSGKNSKSVNSESLLERPGREIKGADFREAGAGDMNRPERFLRLAESQNSDPEGMIAGSEENSGGGAAGGDSCKSTRGILGDVGSGST